MDKDAVNLAKAIRRAETGSSKDPYNTKGASGEFGAYQFMPGTWKDWSGKYLGQENAPYTVANQNKVAYSRIKELKDQGLTPAQIASSWNSGDADSYKRGFKGTNDQGVEYDVPAYVAKVSQNYRKLKGNTAIASTTQEVPLAPLPQAPQASPQPQKKQFLPKFEAVPNEPVKNVFRAFGNIPTSTAKLGKEVVAPINPFDKESKTNIGVNFVEGIKAVGDIFSSNKKTNEMNRQREIAEAELARRGRPIQPTPEVKSSVIGNIAGGGVETVKTGFNIGKQVAGNVQKEVETKGFGGAVVEGLSKVAETGIEDPLLIPSLIYAPSKIRGTGVATDTISIVARPVTSTASKVKSVVKEKVATAVDNKVDKVIAKDLDDFITSKKSLENKVNFYETKRNTPVKKIISEPYIYKGIEVKKGKVDATEAISRIDSRIDNAMDLKKPILAEIDKKTTPLSRETFRERALKIIDESNDFTPANKLKIRKAINTQIDALPDNLTLTEADNLRAIFRKESRNAQQLQKRTSEYTALENAFRDTVFDTTDNLPFDTSGEFANLNKFIKDQISTKEFLEKTMQGQTVKGGRLGRYTGRALGAVAGSQGGIITTLLGAEAGDIISQILINNQLGSSIKMKLIQGVTDNPQVIKEAEKLLNSTKQYNPLNTPALQSGAIVTPPPRGIDNIQVVQGQSPNMSRKNTANSITTTVPNNPNPNIPKTIQSNQNKATGTVGDNIKPSTRGGFIKNPLAPKGKDVIKEIDELTKDELWDSIKFLKGEKSPITEKDFTRLANKFGISENQPVKSVIRRIEEILDKTKTKSVPPKSSIKEIYHGTDKVFDEFDVTKTPDGSIWFSDSKESILKGESGAASSNRIINRFIDENKLNLAGWEEYEKYSLDQLEEMGFDGVKLPEGNKIDYQIFKPEKLKKPNQRLPKSKK